MTLDDDGSTSSDSSNDHSSLHVNSGPIMGGKGPGPQLDWMNKFKVNKNNTNNSKQQPLPQTATTTTTSTPAPERRVITRSSSFLRGEMEKPEQPEWMKKFQTMNAHKTVTDGTATERDRSPSPTRETIQNQLIPPTAPTTPSWMKQFQKGPLGPGAPILPSVPSLSTVSSSSSTSTTTATATANTNNAEKTNTAEKAKPKKDWKALVSKSKATTEPAPAVVPVVPKTKPVAPATPQWMNKFSGVGKGVPMAPQMYDDDSDDDKSVTSVSSAISVEPEWMSQFNKVKSGAGIEPKKIKPPSNSIKREKTSEPEWIQKFQKRNSIAEPSSLPLPSPKGPGPEPEWMTRFREIGFRGNDGEQASPIRNPKVSSQHPPTSGLSPQMNNSFSNRNTLGKPTTTLSASGKVANTAISKSSFLPPLASPAGRTGKLTISAKLLANSNGMLSAPSSPTSSGKLTIHGGGGGGTSAPSSPVTGPRNALNMSAVLTMSPGPPTVQRRNSLEITKQEPKTIDPAAMAPETPAWMNKVKAVAHSGKDEPEWMLKLKRRKQDINELGPEKGTPPWKVMDRMKAEQHQKLVKEVSLSRLDYMHKAEVSMNDSKLFNHEESDEESEDEENIPEWMRQFKKMHLKEAEVLSYAQGRAPQGVSRLRRGSMQMIERSDKYNPAEEPARAIPIILKLPKKMSKRNIYGPTMEGSSSKDLDKSIGNIESAILKQEDSATEGDKPAAVEGKVQVAQMQPKTSSVVNALPTKSSQVIPRKSSEQSLSEDQATDSTPATASDGPSRYTEQVEIDNSKPENVMNMWGKTVKSKKPGNATLMSFRMIQNQAELVKERIARAKQKAEAGENRGVESDEESIKDVETMTLSSSGGMDNSAAALFGAAKSGNTTKRTSVAMDNSAAALFGFGGGAVKRESVSLDNSAAALFGFGGGTVKRESVSMDNSAAALFGFAKSHELSNSLSVDHVAESSKSSNMDNSVSMNNSAAALFGMGSVKDENTAADHSPVKNGESAWAKGKSIAEEDSSDDDSSKERNKAKNLPGQRKANTLDTKKSFLDDSSSDESSPAGKKKQTQPEVTANKKSFLDDSDSDDSSDEDKPRGKVLPKFSSKGDSDSDSDDEQPKKVLPGPKKFSLDDSSSHDSPKKPVLSTNKDDSDDDDSSDDEKAKKQTTPARIEVKKSFLDDSDSDDSDDEKRKTTAKAISTTPVKKPLTNDSDSDESSAKGKSKQSPKPSPTTLPTKKSFLDDSDSDDSDDDDKKGKLNKPAVSSPVKKSTSDDSSDSSDDEKAKKKVTTATSNKMSFLDGSDSSDDSIGNERPKLVPLKLSTPAFAQPSSDQKKSSDDDSSSSSSSEDSSSAKRKQSDMATKDMEKNVQSSEDNLGSSVASNQGWDQPKAQQDTSSPVKADNNDWDVGLNTNENDEDAAWQKALLELAAEEQAKKEKEEQDAWEAALMELAAEEQVKKEKAEQNAWQAALMELAAEEESKKKDQTDAWDAALRELEEEGKGKEADQVKATDKTAKTKIKAVDKKKTKDNDATAATKVGKQKNKDSDVNSDINKKSTKNEEKEKETKVKNESKDVESTTKIKEKKDRTSSKSPKPKRTSLEVRGAKKKDVDASPFDSSPFGASPFGASPFDAIASPFDAIGASTNGTPSPFAPIGGGATKDSPFAPLDQNSPFGQIGGSDHMSPFAPLGGNGKSSSSLSSPFAPLKDVGKTKKEKKGLVVVKDSSAKKPKSNMKLVVQTTKAKGDLHQKRAKKGEKGKADGDDDDDDSFGNMVDFDDDFSIANDFGDFAAAEDGSVVPLRAIRNSGSKDTKTKTKTTTMTTMFSPKPPVHSATKLKPNLLVKNVEKVKESKESKSTEKEKEKKDKMRSHSKSRDKKMSRSRSDSEDKKSSRSRSKSVEKGKSRSRSKSRSGRKERSSSIFKDKKKESRERSSSLGKGKSSRKKDKK